MPAQGIMPIMMGLAGHAVHSVVTNPAQLAFRLNHQAICLAVGEYGQR